MKLVATSFLHPEATDTARINRGFHHKGRCGFKVVHTTLDSLMGIRFVLLSSVNRSARVERSIIPKRMIFHKVLLRLPSSATSKYPKSRDSINIFLIKLNGNLLGVNFRGNFSQSSIKLVKDFNLPGAISKQPENLDPSTKKNKSPPLPV